MLFLNAEDVTRSLPMPQAIESMKKALIAIAEKSVEVPIRHHLNVQPHDNTLLVMPAVIDPHTQPGFTVKVASVCPSNAVKQLPTVQSIVIAFNSETGETVAILDGKAITSIRTAATSAAATDTLARDDSRILAVLGAGALARPHIRAMACVRDIKKVQVYSRSAFKVEQLIEDFSSKSETKFEIRKCVSAKEALADADIICTVTSSNTPIFDASDVQDGTHINAVGAYTPQMAEIPSRTIECSRVFVEQIKTAIKEGGDLAIPIREGRINENHIIGEIGCVLSGELPGRQSKDDRTIFKSVGNAGEDAFAVQTAVRFAKANNIGHKFNW